MPNQPNFIERKENQFDERWYDTFERCTDHELKAGVKDFLRSSLLEQREMILGEIEGIAIPIYPYEVASGVYDRTKSTILSKVREI